MKTHIFFLCIAALICCSCGTGPKADRSKETDGKIVLAYVTSWSDVMPEASHLTHINYAFGHVTDDFRGVRIDNVRRFKKIVRLKKKWPHLKVLLSVGGWGSGRFSEMASNELYRLSFAKSCAKAVKRYKLDGIDIDWEYPTSSAAEISSSPGDRDNYTLLMRDLRAALGPDKLLTHATGANARYYDFKALDRYVDFTNVMSYDLGWAPYHNSPLYRSAITEEMSADEAVKAHIDSGVPANKLVMGLAFYGHFGHDRKRPEGFPRQRDLNNMVLPPEFVQVWDSIAQVPYITGRNGELVFGYENSKSLEIKCRYILDNNLRGAMWWSYEGDNPAGEMRRTVYETLYGVE